MEISLVANGEFSQMLSCDYFAKGQGLSFSKNNFGGKVTLKIQAVKIPFPTERKTLQRDKVSLLVRTTLGTRIQRKFKLEKYLVPTLKKTSQRDKVSLLL